MGKQVLTVDVQEVGERLDRFLSCRLPGITRSQIKKAIDRGAAQVEGAPARAGTRLRVGQRVTFEAPAPEPPRVEPEPLALDIVFEDASLIVVNKPAGMVVHPGAGHRRGTLVAGLLSRCRLEGGDADRPGIVHRLDKDTSGLLVVTKDVRAHEALARQFREHSAGRRYVALVQGVPPPRGTIRTAYGRDPRHRIRFSSKVLRGREAVTHFEVVERYGREASMVVCLLETGRTHQVRVHLADSGHPILADPLYGGGRCRSEAVAAVARQLGRQALHAERLVFTHPFTNERLELTAAPPPDFQAAREALRGIE